MQKPDRTWWWLGAAFAAGFVTRLWHPGSLLSRVNLIDIALALVVVVIGLRRPRPVWHPPLWLTGWLAVAALSLFVGANWFGWSSTALLYLVRIIIASLFFTLAANWSAVARWNYVTWLGGAIAGLGLVQLAVFPSISMQMVQTYGFDPHSGRLFALWFDPNIAGVLLAITLTATIAWLLSRPAKPWLYGGLALLQAAALLLTQSRSAWITFGGMLFILLLMLSRRTLILLLAGAIMLPILSTSVANRLAGALAVDDSSSARFVSWETAWQVVKLSPVVGVGYNYYQEATVVIDRYHPQLGRINLAANGSDSSLLTVWATTGAVGLLLFLGWLWQSGWRTVPAEPDWRRAGRRAILIGLLIDSLFINSLLLGPVWFLLALVCA